MSGTTVIMRSNPEQHYGKIDVNCLTLPNGTIFIEIYFWDLNLGKKIGTISDPCPATGAQTDVNHITITNGQDVLFYCGGIHLVKPESFKRAITSSENNVLVNMTSLDQHKLGSYQLVCECKLPKLQLFLI